MRVRTALATAALLLTAGPAAAGPGLRGVIEGYYGRPWTGEARRDVIRFLGAHRMNAFAYAPKNDEYHRARWRDPYPAAELADLEASVAVADTAHVRFIYTLTPALDVCHACEVDFTALTAKLAQLAAIGVRRFALLFDDAPAVLTHPEDVARYGGSDTAALGRAQADLVNRTARWLRTEARSRLLFMVPTEYSGNACTPYHDALRRGLRAGIGVGWTGSGVFAETITADEARARRRCLRHPVILWDNYPVNDTVLSINLHLGPLSGRSGDLPSTLAGHLVNPMTQAHASLVGIGTAAAYHRAPRRYDPEVAWQEALAELGGPGFAVLAENTRSSALDLDDARPLASAVDAVAATYDGADWPAAVDGLATEASRQAVAPAAIAVELGGTALGDEIAPWVAELGVHAARDLEAAALLGAMKPAFASLGAVVASGMLQVSGQALAPDAATASALGPGFAAEAAATAARIAAPDLGGFLACLGNFLGADIQFCTAYGLNVHGKALYIVIALPAITIVTDRNVHDRLVLLTGGAYDAWFDRQGPGADALALTLDGSPVPLAPDGGFATSIPVPPSGRARLVVATAAGDATAAEVP